MKTAITTAAKAAENACNFKIDLYIIELSENRSRRGLIKAACGKSLIT
jgi:hypothetical protein